MMLNRRQFVATAALLPLSRLARSASGRVLVVGGGWGGLSAAAHLRRLAPGLEVLLVDRQPAFVSFALSNRWLLGLGPAALERRDYAKVAADLGYTFLQASVDGIERDRQRVATSAGALSYDWLVLAPGIREDFSAWQVSDAAEVGQLQRRFSSGLVSPADLPDLKRRLQDFRGGDLVMSIPPAPYRCPPAPYERAMLIAWWLKTRKIRGRLIVIDPNPLMPAFRTVLLEHFREQVTYLDHARIRQIDLARQMAITDVDEIHFDEALLCPPQQASALLDKAGLMRRDETGSPTGWGDQEVLDFRAVADKRVFIIGDAVGLASPLFGHFPKTGHIASRMGAIVAQSIAAQAEGKPLVASLPESICHVMTSVEPPESVRIEAGYRRRVDGFLMQNVAQTRNVGPLTEDAAWAEAQYRDFLRP